MKAAVRSPFSALVMTRFWTPAGAVAVALGAATGGEVVVWPVPGLVLLGARFAEHAVIPAAASKARPTSIPRLLTIVRISAS
jgi:hypothetical protein